MQDRAGALELVDSAAEDEAEEDGTLSLLSDIPASCTTRDCAIGKKITQLCSKLCQVQN